MGQLTVDGQNSDDIMNFGSTVTTTGTSIAIATADTVDFDADVLVANGLTIATVATDIDLGANVDLTSTAGNITANSGVAVINLSGAGTNKITAGGDINLAAVADGANIAELEIQGEAITLAAITLDAGGTSLLDINLDGAGDSGAKTLTAAGAINVGQLTVDGQNSDDIMNFGSTVTTTGTSIAIATADTVDFDADVLAANGLTIATVATDIDLGANVDLTSTAGNITANSGVAVINLSGVGTNKVTAGGDINLAAVADGANIAELEIQGEAITLAAITLDAGGTSLLDINLDGAGDSGAKTLTLSGDIAVGQLTLDGQNADEVIDFGANVDLTVATGAVDLTSQVASLRLTGAGSNIITATAGDLTLPAVTDTATITELGLIGEAITLAAVTLDNDTANLLDIDLDGAGDSGAKTLTAAGAIAVGQLTVDGQNSDDIMNFGSTVTTTGTSIAIATADTVDFDADVLVANGLTIATVATDIDLGANVDLTSTAGNITANSGVAVINLSGAGTNKITAGGDINLAAVADGANIAELEIQGEAITLAAITLDAGGTSLLDINLDGAGDSGAKTLTAAGAINVGQLTVDGQNSDDIMNFGSTVTTTGTSIAIATADTVDFDADVLAANGLTIATVATDIDLGANVDLTSTAGNITANSGVAVINLSGAGTNKITAGGDINLAAVADGANIAELEIQGEAITLAAITLDAGGTSLLDINLDGAGDSGAKTLTLSGDIAVGQLTLDGQNADEVIDFGANVDLTVATGAVDLTSQVASLRLTGAGSNIITATAGDLTLPAVTDTATITELGLIGEAITLAAVTLDNDTANLLDIDLDGAGDSGAKTLTAAGAIAVGQLTVDGQNSDDIMNFGSTVTTTGTSIAIATADTVDFDADVLAANGLTIATVATDIDLGANVDLTSTAGNITANSGVAVINLSGVGTNKVTAGGDINLAAVADGANIAELEIQGEAITLAAITLDAGGTSLLDINLDGAGDSGAKTLDINGDVSVVSLTVDGQADDVINLGANADLITTTSGIDLDNGIVAIVLDGAGSNLLTSAADISLAAVTDSASIVELELNAQTSITLAGVELNGGGASLLDIDLDEGADGVGTVLDINGDVSVVSLTVATSAK